MRHPLEFIPQHLRRPMFFIFIVLTILIFSVFNVLDEPFRNPVSPHGIVSLELAFTPYRAHEIISSWKYGEGTSITIDDLSANPIFGIGIVDGYRILPFHYLFFGLGLDYLFMPAYALALSFGLLLMMKGGKSWYLRLVAWMGWGAFAAALFDAVENYALWKELTGNVFSPYPEVAAICASVKFALLIEGLLTVIVGRFVKSG